jgi:hypothetical protein
MPLLYDTAQNVGGATSAQAYGSRIQDMIIRIKEDLGVDELLLAIEDSQRIASDKVSKYLSGYKTKVSGAVTAADKAAIAKANQLVGRDGDNLTKAFNDVQGTPVTYTQDTAIRSGKNIEKLVTITWKNTYEMEMEDVNAMMPLAQQIVSKYMSNFNVRPKMG